MSVEQRKAVYLVQGQKIIYSKKDSYSGSLLTNTLGVYEFEFRTDSEWTEFDKVALYLQATGVQPTYIELTNTDIATCTTDEQGNKIYTVPVPEQMLTKAGQLTVGLIGYYSNQDDFRFPTNTDSSYRIAASVQPLDGKQYPQYISIMEQILLRLYKGQGGSTEDLTELRRQVAQLNQLLKQDGDGTKFLSNDGTYKEAATKEYDDTQLKSELSDTLKRNNVTIDDISITGYVSNTGSDKPGSFYVRSDYIKVLKGDTIYYCLGCTASDSNLVSLYDSSKVYYDGVAKGPEQVEGKIIATQDGYVRACCTADKKGDYYFFINNSNYDLVSSINRKFDLQLYSIYNETTTNGGMAADTGAANTDGNMYRFDIIPADAGQVIEYCVAVATTSLCAIAVYGKDGNLIDTYIKDNPHVLQRGTLVLPENTAFVQFSCKRSDYTKQRAYFKFISFGELTTLETEKLNSNFKDRVEPVSTEVGLLHYDGTIAETMTSYETGLFILKRGETLIADIVTNDADRTGNASAFEYFENGAKLRMITNSPNGFTYTSTKEKEYIKVCYTKSQSRSFYIVSNNRATVDEILTGLQDCDVSLFRYRYKTALCIGDSLTFGGQTGISGTNCDTNYPDFLARMTGMTVTNAGFSGISAKGWYDEKFSSYTYTDYEAIFICLGTNQGVTGDNLTAYNNIVSGIKSANPNIAIFLINAKWYTDATNDNIKQIAADNDCAFINVFDNSRAYSLRGIKNNTTPYCDIEGDMTHLSPTGYLVMAKGVVDGMCKDIALHPYRYNQRKLV